MRYIGLFLSFLIITAIVSGGCHRTKLPKAVVETNMGTFVITLYSKDAPNTVKNFMELSERKFYDGSIFPKAIKDNMVQGGDPRGDGNSTPGYIIAAEFNKRKNDKGAVGMAHGYDPNSAGCIFYICIAPAHDLDYKYTVFGKVTKGLDVVKKISEVPVDEDQKPLKPVYIIQVTIER